MLERVAGHQHRVRGEQVAHREVGGEDDAHLGQVAGAALEQLVVRAEDDEHARSRLDGAQQLDDGAGARYVELETAENRDVAVLRLGRERAAQGEAALLARHLLAVAARRRPEDHTAPRPLRRADRSLAGAPSALLAPRLLATAAHLGAGLGVMGALAGVGELAEQRLVHHRGVDRAPEDRLGQLQLTGGRAGLVDDCDTGHYSVSSRSLGRISTTPFLCPGPAPLSSSRLPSPSTRTTSRGRTVRRTWP